MQCIQCGADIINTSGGNYYCTKCGAGINDLVFRPHNCDIPTPQGQQQGWICPICGRGVAPWLTWCPCVNNITYSNINSTSGTNTTYSLKNDGSSQTTVAQTDSEWMKFSTYTDNSVGGDVE